MQLLSEFTIQKQDQSMPVRVYQKRKKHSSAMFRNHALHIYLSHHVRGSEVDRLIAHFVDWGKEQRRRPHRTDQIREWVRSGQIHTCTGETFTLRWKWTTRKRLSTRIEEDTIILQLPLTSKYLDQDHPNTPALHLLTNSVLDQATKAIGILLSTRYHSTISTEVHTLHQAHLRAYHLGTISFQHLKSRWGSCDPQGNLCFNTQLLFLPMKYLHYVIIHELCHLKHAHHRSTFWQEVERILPHAQTLRKELNQYE